MNTFNQHINTEGITIQNFMDIQNDMKIEEIKNESYSRYDFEFISGTTVEKPDGTIGLRNTINGLCEVKTRNSNITDYQSKGILIELNKMAAVIHQTTIKQEEYCNLNYQPFYLTKYNDVTYLFNLLKCEIGNIELIRCPKSSSSNGNNEYIDKGCVLLKPSDAVLTISHI